MKKWWKEAVFYQIYMPSFCDGNGDGIGDFIGITSKLDYLVDLGIDGIWLTPFYKSPKVDNGYDISDFYSVDPDYGTMEDFETFLKEAHAKGIKVIVDLVLNHTSSEHAWFKESRTSKSNPKRDWYIWKDPVNGQEPNNWESFMGGSAWKYDSTTNQYYYHGFAEQQVDLNWTNPEVKQAMLDVMKFWLDKGIDGFRLDVINHLKVSDQFPDNPVDPVTGEQIHRYDKDQEGILDVIKEICAFVRTYTNKFLVGEVGSEDLEVLKKYSGNDLLDVVFQFNLGSIPSLDIDHIYQEIVKMDAEYREDQIPTLFFGSHDLSRFISRFNRGTDHDKIGKLIATLMLTTKGIPFIYYGDEIGMQDLVIEDIAEMKDVQGIIAYQMALEEGKGEEEALKIANKKGRDSSRSPMQWSSREYFGFSTVKPWISLPNNDITVENQLNDPNSILFYYKKLISLRKKIPALTYGEYEKLEKNNDLIMYKRNNEDSSVVVYLNFGSKEEPIPVLEDYKICLSSLRRIEEINSPLYLLPYEAIVMVKRKEDSYGT